MKTVYRKDKNRNDITSLFVIAPNWKPPKCPSVDKYSNKELNLGSDYFP